MPTTTPNKSHAYLNASGAAGDTLALSSGDVTFDQDVSGKLNGGKVYVQVTPDAALTSYITVGLRYSTDGVTWIESGQEIQAGLSAATPYDYVFDIDPDAIKVRLYLNNPNSGSGPPAQTAKYTVQISTYDSVTTV